MNNYYTENLADFGPRERAIVGEILSCSLPDGFYNSGVRLAFNRNTGYVFLVNDDCQCAMLDGDELKIFHSTPYGWHEGFLSELLEREPSEYHEEDAEYIRGAAKNENVELPESWK